MARNRYRPGRHVAVFFLGLAIAYGLVALLGTWSPSLGLDLRGGTRITLAATGNDVTESSLTEAAGIIDDRVNGSGVSEAEVTTQGNQFVTVEIPGESRQDLVNTVKRQAQLRFRVVAGCDKTAETCRAKFSNFLNFRGFPHIPGDDWVTAYPKNGAVHDGSSLQG